MSEWKQGAAKRRDERRTAVPAIRKPSGSKRNTKKWCRGVVGREHKPQCVSYNEAKGTTFAPDRWKILRCTECGKELDYYWPSTIVRVNRPTPAWAAEKSEP